MASKTGLLEGTLASESHPDNTLDSILRENDRLSHIKSVLKEQHRHVIPINDLYAKVPASLTYEWYSYMWFRDSSKGVMHLASFLESAKKTGLDKIIDEDISAVSEDLPKIIRTMWAALEFFVYNVSGNEVNDIRLPESTLGKNHVLSRFDVGLDGSISLAAPDAVQPSTVRSWLMQYDSVPLVLMATNKYLNSLGPAKIMDVIPKIKNTLPWLVNYIKTFYNTPCADAWESYYVYGNNGGRTIDSYSVSSIYGGLTAAEELARSVGSELTDTDKMGIEEFLKSNFLKPEDMSKAFINKSKIEYGDTIESVDSEAVEILRIFKPGNFSDKVANNTLKRVEEELIGKNVLPIRYKFFGSYNGIKDTYFNGGRWFPNGLELSMLYMDLGNMEKASTIINYVEGRINPDGSIPEQEIVDPVCYDCDNYHFLERNGNKPINCLWWSETAYLAAVGSYLEKRLDKEPV